MFVVGAVDLRLRFVARAIGVALGPDYWCSGRRSSRGSAHRCSSPRRSDPVDDHSSAPNDARSRLRRGAPSAGAAVAPSGRWSVASSDDGLLVAMGTRDQCVIATRQVRDRRAGPRAVRSASGAPAGHRRSRRAIDLQAGSFALVFGLRQEPRPAACSARCQLLWSGAGSLVAGRSGDLDRCPSRRPSLAVILTGFVVFERAKELAQAGSAVRVQSAAPSRLPGTACQTMLIGAFCAMAIDSALLVIPVLLQDGTALHRAARALTWFRMGVLIAPGAAPLGARFHAPAPSAPRARCGSVWCSRRRSGSAGGRAGDLHRPCQPPRASAPRFQ